MIELRHVSKSIGKHSLLTDINLTIPPGQVTYLIGENGSGKTTIMNLIMQLIPRGKGDILLDDQPITFDSFHRISYVPDQIVVLKHFTVRQALDQMADYYPLYNPVKASEMIEFFNLPINAPVRTLSKGNTAKLSILLGLSLETDYILMDEPFSGIDVFTREEISDVFTSRLLDGQGVLIASHDVHEMEMLADRAILLKEGRIIEEVIPDQLRAQTHQGLVEYMREVYR